ncbi:MAG: VOC family protein [Candidatus Acidiferrales bacterium]
MKINKITAVLFAEDLAPCVKFWAERAGFQKTIEVPDGNNLAFVALQKDGVELMYQSFASADKDFPAISRAVRQGPTFLYIDVENVDEFIDAMEGVQVSMPVRTTFYGAKEFGVKDPAGHYITFAQQGVAAAAH